MSINRQTPLRVDFPLPAALLARAEDHAAGTRLPPHTHDSAQLIHARQGVMTVDTEDGIWVVPPERAVWVPATVVHGIRMVGRVALRTLYLDPRNVPIPGRRCCVVGVSAILRAAILRAVDFEQPYPARAAVGVASLPKGVDVEADAILAL